MSLKYKEDYDMIIDFINLYSLATDKTKTMADRLKAVELQKLTLEILPHPENHQEESIRNKMKEVYEKSKRCIENIKSSERTLVPISFPRDGDVDSLPKTKEKSRLDSTIAKMKELKDKGKPEKNKIIKTLAEIKEIEKDTNKALKNEVDRVMIYFRSRSCPVCSSVNHIWEKFVSDNYDSDINFIKIEIEEDPRIFDIYGITSYPSIILSDRIPHSLSDQYEIDLSGYDMLYGDYNPYAYDVSNMHDDDYIYVYKQMLRPFTYDNLRSVLYNS